MGLMYVFVVVLLLAVGFFLYYKKRMKANTQKHLMKMKRHKENLSKASKEGQEIAYENGPPSYNDVQKKMRILARQVNLLEQISEF